MSTSASSQNSLRSDRACFDGLMLCALAYGALVMICVQLVQVLIHRPRRDRTFYFIILYTLILFPLTTAAFLGRLTFAELTYVVNSSYKGGPSAYYMSHSNHWSSYLSKVCATIMPWLADILMLYRVFVLCGRQVWLLVLPSAIYLARIATSIPILIATFHPERKFPNRDAFNIAQGATYLALNVFITIVICVRLFTMKHKAERVLGRLQATLYNSYSTLFVESGAFFTLWSIVYLILKLTDSWAQDVFWQPYVYVVAVTRMLVVLRMAQNKAWTREIIEAADDGLMEWGVSSSSSVDFTGQHDQRLEKSNAVSFRDDGSTIRSVRL